MATKCLHSYLSFYTQSTLLYYILPSFSPHRLYIYNAVEMQHYYITECALNGVSLSVTAKTQHCWTYRITAPH